MTMKFEPADPATAPPLDTKAPDLTGQAHPRTFTPRPSPHREEPKITPAIAAFLDDIEAVCRKHGMSIEHQDGHGAFEIWEFNQDAIEWLRAADDCRTAKGT